MQSHVNELNPVEVEVKAEVPWERVKESLERQYRDLQRTVRVKGFRPGKVPRNVVRNLMGKQVRGEVTQTLVQEALASAVQEHSLQPVAMPSLEETPEVREGQPLAFTAKMEVRPKVGEIDTDIEVQRPPVEVTDEQVDREIENLREQNAEMVTPEPERPATKGDVLTVDYTVTIDGQEREDLGGEDRQIEVGSDRLLPELVEGLVGVRPGDEKTITVHFGEDFQREDLQGKDADFHVKVKELREKHLPEVDDEFAKDCGDYESLDDLKRSIRERLEESAKQHTQSTLKERVIDALVEKNPIPVPPSLVNQQLQQMTREMLQIQQMMGQEPNLSEEMTQDLKQRGERKVRAGLLFGELADRENLSVGKEDLDAKFQELAEKTGKHAAKIRAEYQGEEREALESQILEDKLLEYLLSRATIKDEPPSADEDNTPAEESNAP